MLQRKLTSLEIRKQMLVAESEINRTLLAKDCQILVSSARARFHPAHLLGAVAEPIISFISKLRGGGEKKTAASKGFGWASSLMRWGLGIWLGRQSAGMDADGESTPGPHDEVSSY